MCAQIFELGFFNADPHPGNVALRFDEYRHGTVITARLGLDAPPHDCRIKGLA